MPGNDAEDQPADDEKDWVGDLQTARDGDERRDGDEERRDQPGPVHESSFPCA